MKWHRALKCLFQSSVTEQSEFPARFFLQILLTNNCTVETLEQQLKGHKIDFLYYLGPVSLLFVTYYLRVEENENLSRNLGSRNLGF